MDLVGGSCVSFVGRPWQHVANLSRMGARTQEWVTLTTMQRGLVLLHHLPPQFEQNGLSIARGVALVEMKKHSKVLVANFSDNIQRRRENKVIGQVSLHLLGIFSTEMDVSAVLAK